MEPEKERNNKIFILAIVVFTIGIIIGLILNALGNNQTNTVETTPTPRPISIPISAPPEPQVDPDVLETMTFELDASVFQNTYKLEITLEVPENSSAEVVSLDVGWPAYQISNNLYRLNFILPYESFEAEFEKNTFSLGYLGDLNYVARNYFQDRWYYSNDNRLLNSTECNAFGEILKAPCGLPLVKNGELGIQISCMAIDSNLNYCDNVIKTLELKKVNL